MVFSGVVKQKNANYIAPFNYETGLPDLGKARKITGIEGKNTSLNLYKGASAYYVIFRNEDSGAIYVKKSAKLTGKFKLVQKISPTKGSYYYGPTFVLNQSGKVQGLTYSSYYYDESNNLAYSGAYYQKGIVKKSKPERLSGKFVLQKFSFIKVGATQQ